MTTSDVGVYTTTNLPVGKYDITVSREGFATGKYAQVELTVDQILTLNVALKLGSRTETIEVSGGEVAPITLENAQLSNVVTQQQMQAMPLIVRDPYSLVLLSPGTMQSNSSLGGFSVNGSRERDNNFLLDGVDNNDTSVPGIPGGLTSLNPDATQEFRVITNNFAPEFGRNNGAIVDIVTKSGTNIFHGDAYWFGRWNGFGGARDFFNTSDQPMNPYVRNLFGGSFGGPIRKNKTFFFVNEEIQRFRTTLNNTSTVPSHDFKTGKFTFQGQNIDLTSTTSPNNIKHLPLNPTTQKILSLYPDPNGGAVDDIRGLLFFSSASKQDVTNLTTKIDHTITTNNVLSVRWAYGTFSDPDPFHDDFLPGIGGTASRQHTYNLGTTLTSTLKPTLINDARFGWNKLDASFSCGNLSTIDSVGLTDQFGRGRDYDVSHNSGFGCVNLFESNAQSRRTGTWTVADNMTWVKSTHTLKFGGEYRRVYENGFVSFNSRDLLSFNGFTDQGVSFVGCGAPCAGASVLQDMADFLFGQVESEFQAQFFNSQGTRTADDLRKFRQHDYAFFAQDSWKLRPSVTLTYGLRWQFNGVPYEVNNNLSNLYTDPSAAAQSFTFQLAGPGTGQLLYHNNWHDFEPRIGLAWDPFHKGTTSVRLGYGLFHDRIFGNLFGNARSNPPFQQTFSSFLSPFETVENLPIPSNLTPTATVFDQTSSPNCCAPIEPILFDPNLHMPYSQNWNVGIEHELAKGLALEVNYVGSKGTHLLTEVDGNPPQPQLVQALIADGVDPSLLQFVRLYFGVFFGLPFNAVNNNAFASPTNFAAPGTFTQNSVANSIYHGLQTKLTRRMWHGMQVQASYTWSHAIDDANDTLVAPGSGRGLPRNSFNRAAERGNSGFDLRHRLVVNYLYELPFGKGKTHLNSGFLGRVMEGWRISGITSWQTGLPFDLFDTTDTEHTGLSSRVDLVGDPAIPADAPHSSATGVQTGPPVTAFAVPPFGRGGNVGRNRFYGAHFYDWDGVVSKTMGLTERVRLETRFEFYNVFNHPEFGIPGTQFVDPGTFGISTSTISRPDGTTSARQMQVGMKLHF